jgi:hypothetical protein
MKSDEKLVAAVLARSKETDGRKSLTCAEALSVAAELDVDAAQIGRICDQQKIRICSCQLGCFS